MIRQFFTHRHSVLLFTTLALVGFIQTAGAAILFVDRDATGANDGTSWNDAFNDLQDALSTAATGDTIWVAEGIYRPDTLGGSTAATFHILKNIHLYGGFAGTETSLAQRDPDNHLTILSGDLGSDDLPSDLDSNRSDNAMTILLVAEVVSHLTVIDGFTIRNGHAAGNDSLFYHRRGAGIFSFGAPIIRQCRFVENYADRGGCIYLHGPAAAGTQVEHCFFENNGAEEGGAIMAFYVDGDGMSVSDCQFEGNHASNWGGAIRVFNSNCAVSNSFFEGNTASRGGGALEIRSNVDDNETAFSNCHFNQNKARQGGAIRFQTSSGLGSHNNKLFISDCVFDSNEAVALDTAQMGGRAGGAIQANIERTSNGGTVLIEDSEFMGNFSEQNGGALMAELEGVDYDLQLKACVFMGNTAGQSGTVNLAASEVGEGHAVIESCLFQNNSAESRGGGLVFGGNRSVRAGFQVLDCAFLENNVAEAGGGLSIYCRDTAFVEATVAGCDFDNNTALLKGGAVYATADNDQLSAVFEKCIFSNNQSPAGAAIALGHWAANNLGSGSSYLLDNCLLYANVGESTIHCDSFPTLQFINCTIANNQSGAIYQATEGTIMLQNTILFNPGFVAYAYPATPGVPTSLGGNFIGDGSLDAILSASDNANMDPAFTNVNPYPYQLSSLSPCINTGIDPGSVPDTDLAGNPRVQNGCIDAGAFESAFNAQCYSGLAEQAFSGGTIAILPNPVGETMRVQIENEWTGLCDFRISNCLGQTLETSTFEKTGHEQYLIIKTGSMPQGIYRLTLSQAGKRLGALFVKR